LTSLHREAQNLSRNREVSHLARYAVLQLNRFDSKLKFILDAIKNLSLAARSARNLYECAVSANNADSTL